MAENSSIEWTDHTWNPLFTMSDYMAVFTKRHAVRYIQAQLWIASKWPNMMRVQIAAPTIAAFLAGVAITLENGDAPFGVFNRAARFKATAHNEEQQNKTLSSCGGNLRASNDLQRRL